MSVRRIMLWLMAILTFAALPACDGGDKQPPLEQDKGVRQPTPPPEQPVEPSPSESPQ